MPQGNNNRTTLHPASDHPQAPRETPFFSIIVPAYNVESYLSECIDSVLAQDFQDYELILVDDGSTDQTGAICEEYQKSRALAGKNQPHNSIVAQNSQKVNIKVLHQPNSGLSAARNTGISQASGEYLLFLDGDDYLEPGALSIIHQALVPNIIPAPDQNPPTQAGQGTSTSAAASSHQPIDLLRFQAQEIFENGKITQYSEPGFSTMSGPAAFQPISRYHYIENAWLYAYRRAFFLEHHFQYAEGCIAEDFGLTLLILAQAKTVKSIPDVCYNYRQRAGSITRGAASILRRTRDIEQQLAIILPKITAIPGTTPILYYLVESYLTSATLLSLADFLQFYQSAQCSGWLRYLRPARLRSVPRAFVLKHFPNLFYHLYRRRDVL